MDIRAEQKYLLASPQKIREVAGLVKNLSPLLAVESLLLVNKKAAGPIRKVILQALANAKNKGLSENDLIFKEIQIGEGPRLKRGQPVSRGQWHPIVKKMSHIRVVLTTKTPNSKALNSNEIQKTQKLQSENKRRKGGIRIQESLEFRI